jgi:hypothetical protein
MVSTFGHGLVAGVLAFVLVGVIESWLNFRIA